MVFATSGWGASCWRAVLVMVDAFFVTLVVVDGGWLLVMVDIVGSHCYRRLLVLLISCRWF